MRNDGRKRIPIQVAEAVERVMKYAKHGEVEEISITESYGRILGEDVVSDHDVPHFDRSLRRFRHSSRRYERSNPRESS